MKILHYISFVLVATLLSGAVWGTPPASPTDACPGQAEDHDWFQDDDGCPDPDNDNDGIPDDRDDCPGTDADVAAGRPTAEVKNGVLDQDGCPETLPPVRKTGPVTARKVDIEIVGKIAPEIKKGVPLVLTNITFMTGSAELTDSARTILFSVYESLTKFPHTKIEIRGYADMTGTDAYNQALSQTRAESVMGYMVEMGLAANRFSARGYGRKDPIADNTTAKGRAQNRRVEFHRVD